MCSHKQVGQRGVEGENYRYLFVDWRRGEPEGMRKYVYFDRDICFCETKRFTSKCIGLATYKSSNGKLEKIKHCPQSWQWMQSKRKENQAVSTSPTETQPKISPLKAAFTKLAQSQRNVLQSNLKNLGYYKSTIDGLYGRGTSGALTAYNKKYLGGSDLKKSNNVVKLINTVMALNTSPAPKTASTAKPKSVPTT